MSKFFNQMLEEQYPGSLSGGRGKHSSLLGFGLPPIGNFDLKVNQLIVALYIININKSLKYYMYVYIYILYNNPSSFSTLYSDHTVFGHIIGTLCRIIDAGITKTIVKTTISACDIIFYHLV